MGVEGKILRTIDFACLFDILSIKNPVNKRASKLGACWVSTRASYFRNHHIYNSIIDHFFPKIFQDLHIKTSMNIDSFTLPLACSMWCISQLQLKGDWSLQKPWPSRLPRSIVINQECPLFPILSVFCINEVSPYIEGIIFRHIHCSDSWVLCMHALSKYSNT